MSPAMAVGPHYASAASNASPLFMLPVDTVQRARDHGVPSYNDVREVSVLIVQNVWEAPVPRGIQ